MKKISLLVAILVLGAAAASAVPVSQQIGAGDTALLFGGTDAEGGIGDWYVSNGVIEAIIDDVNVQTDLTALLGAGNEPPTQSEAAFTGGNLLDLGRNGQDSDQLAQMFTVGGLSTANFILNQSISAPVPGTVRATGKLLFPPVSTAAAPCVDVVTDYTASGSGAFLEISTTATNNCGAPIAGFGGFLDVFVWTLRGLVPFSSGGTPPVGGKGFDHPALDLNNPAAALELPVFMAAPGQVRPADGLIDPANGTTSGEVGYGLLGMTVVVDPDGSGPTPPTPPTAVNTLFGVSSTLISALGNLPVGGGDGVGASLTYTRRIYVGGTNDVRSAANDIVPELASRIPFNTGTISGDVNASDTASVEASILVRRVGRCNLAPATPCRANADCGANGPCVDPVPTGGGQVPGAAIDHIRTDTTGAFSGVVLPQGDYELVVSAAERDDVVVPVVTVASGNTAVSVPTLTGRGTVDFTVREKRAGFPLLPAKLTFEGVTPTVDPRFHRDLKATLGGNDVFPETFGGTQAGTSGHAAGQGNVVYTATGAGNIQVRPGTYDIYASRGNEYSVVLKRVTVTAGQTSPVDFRLKRVLKTTNALSADFHVHSGRSLDASAPLRDRVAAFAAEGVEVMVATDHDKHVDYAPIISAFGLASRLRSIIGNEMTGSVPNDPAFPNSIGHINAWPLPLDKDQSRDSAIQDEYVAPNFVFKRLRDQGAEVVQYNHPRAGVSGLTTIGIFNNIGCNRCENDIDVSCSQDSDCPAAPPPQNCTCVGYQPDRTIGTAPNDILLDKGVIGPGSPDNPDGTRNIDFDVMEVMNGSKDNDFPGLRQVRRDWLSLLNQGIYRPGTAVSDSHRITVEHAGWARTYVFGVGDDPAAFGTTAFDNQVKAGRMLMSGGPYVECSARATNAHLQPAGPGDLLSVTNGKIRLKVKVTSPAWMPVEEVRVIANGFIVNSFDGTTTPHVRPVPANFQSTGRTRRFNASLTFFLIEDTYFICEAGAKLPASVNDLPTPPPIVDIVEPDVVPFAATNPIFVDTNGDSDFDPPGLPVMMASAAPAAGSETPGLLARLRHALVRLAARITGEAIAEEQPGEMTGVTKEQKEEAAKKGEYFPLREFAIPPEAVEAARKAAEEAGRQAAPQPAEGAGQK
jgi:hypothetical protein